MNEWLNKLFDNPNWQGADQLAIYKAQPISKVDLTTTLQVWRPDQTANIQPPCLQKYETLNTKILCPISTFNSYVSGS